MNFPLPKIYPVTDVRLSKLSHAAQVEKLCEGGAQLIQLREKYVSPKEFYEAAAKALEVARKYSVKIIINDRADIALALKADGVHLGQDDLPPVEARKILGEKAIIGFSTHNLKQAALAVKMPIDYLAIGPVFETRTKENPDKLVGLEDLKNVRQLVGNFPLVAIGGITLENFRQILNCGADSAAVIGDLIGQTEDISHRLNRFLT